MLKRRYRPRVILRRFFWKVYFKLEDYYERVAKHQTNC